MGNLLGCLSSNHQKVKGTTSTSEEPKTLQAYGAAAYELVGQLGTGKSGTMKLMKNKKTKELVAAKFVERVAGVGLSKNTEREIVNHRRLLHPNIIRFHEVYMDEDFLVIVMEYASGGTVEDRVKSQGPLEEEKARDLFLQLTSGLEYCHSKSIFHRDLRLQNLHLHGSHFSPQLKITGFGYSKSAILDSQLKTNVGSPCYTPPELLTYTMTDGGVYDGGPNDVWSAGIILFYMLTGTMAFEDSGHPGALNRKMMQKIVNVEYEFPAASTVSRECRDFVAKIFTKDPGTRITIPAMRKHPWLAGTSLPNGAGVDQSPQTELEIHEIVEKARRRRNTEKSARSPEKLNSVESVGGANGLNGSRPLRGFEPKTPDASEVGIAEVMKKRGSLPAARPRRSGT